ncbi:MAG: methylenetetrahydrofolate reductase C-terminal domain-containing protein, partial [Candidatus Latescibacterota bacterium]
PQSQCPKQQRNAPCGGSRLDACEVYPDRPCVWNRVYTRAKAFGELEQVRTSLIGPRDWKLRNTSGWVNFHLDRDHAGYDFAKLFEGDKEPLGTESGIPAKEQKGSEPAGDAAT